MIKSMTGYGRAREVRNKRDITVEVRSVNNRYLDCAVKMPRMYSFAEDAVKQCVQKAFAGQGRRVYHRGRLRSGCGQSYSEPGTGGPVCRPRLNELSEVCGTEQR